MNEIEIEIGNESEGHNLAAETDDAVLQNDNRDDNGECQVNFGRDDNDDHECENCDGVVEYEIVNNF